MGKGYDKEKNLFYRGLRLKHGKIVFNTEESHGLPYMTDIIKYYNRLLRENKELEKENEKLKSEINMLKTTIGRNEAYIQRMKYTGEWR